MIRKLMGAVALALSLLCVPSVYAQAGGVGQVGRPAPTTGVQVCGRDPSILLACLNFDGSGNLLVAFSGSAVPTGTAGSPNPAVQTVQGISGGTPIGANLYNGTTAATWNTTNADALAASATAGFLGTNSFGRVFNGTTWDRQRGDTNGTWVTEKVRSSFQNETTTNLAANAAFTGQARDAGVSPSQWTSFECFFRSDQVSAANGNVLQSSNDGTTWFTNVFAATASAQNVSTVLKTDVIARYNRCVFTNGTSATGSFIVQSRYGAN